MLQLSSFLAFDDCLAGAPPIPVEWSSGLEDPLRQVLQMHDNALISILLAEMKNRNPVPH